MEVEELKKDRLPEEPMVAAGEAGWRMDHCLRAQVGGFLKRFLHLQEEVVESRARAAQEAELELVGD